MENKQISASPKIKIAPPERCPVCGGLRPGDITHTRCQ